MRFDYRFPENEPLLRKRLAVLAEDYDMEYDLELYDESAPATRRMAVFVSKEDHCLFDLLYRQRKGELRCEIPLVVSNHETLRPVAEQFGVPFAFVPMDRSLPRDERKAVQEAQVVALLEEAQVDVVVLARYMQILTDDFCSRFKTINIHHSFLPAFAGAKPYHQAHQRGVKCLSAPRRTTSRRSSTPDPSSRRRSRRSPIAIPSRKSHAKQPGGAED